MFGNVMGLSTLEIFFAIVGFFVLCGLVALTKSAFRSRPDVERRSETTRRTSADPAPARPISRPFREVPVTHPAAPLPARPKAPLSTAREAFDPATAEPTSKCEALLGSAYVVDGDTIRIQKTQIRLFGIDAPEMNHPYGKNAKWALVAMCKGKKVRAEIGETDAHGRTVAKCYLPDGTDLSAEMVKIGMAIDWPKYSGGIYRALETPDARKKLWLADARQKGRMHVWEKFEAQRRA